MQAVHLSSSYHWKPGLPNMSTSEYIFSNCREMLQRQCSLTDHRLFAAVRKYEMCEKPEKCEKPLHHFEDFRAGTFHTHSLFQRFALSAGKGSRVSGSRHTPPHILCDTVGICLVILLETSCHSGTYGGVEVAGGRPRRKLSRVSGSCLSVTARKLDSGRPE